MTHTPTLNPAVGGQCRPWAGAALRKFELSSPNLWVRCAFYLSIFGIPFFQLYVPGTGERLGVKRVLQGLMILAMLSRPRVCLRLLPLSLIWFFAYACLRLIAGLWLAPQHSALWVPTTLELFEFLLPWCWFTFNIMHFRSLRLGGLWALVAGIAICALFHIAGIGTMDVDQGIEGRSTVFGQNANEIGEVYGLGVVALVALGLFKDTKHFLRLAVFPLAALVAIGLAKTGSRTGALLAVAGTLILLPQTRAFVGRTRRYLILLLAALVFAGVMYQIPTVFNRLSSAASSDVTHEEARARMIPVLWEIFLRSPFYGSGPDRYQYELTRRAMPYLAEKQQTISSHNLALLLLVETGVIGFSVFAVALGKALTAGLRARYGPTGLLPLAWLLPMTIGGLTISNPIFSPVFWLAIAYALAGPDPVQQ